MPKLSYSKASGYKRSGSGIWVPDYGDGSDGDLTIGANTNWSALVGTGQEMQYTSFTISNTFTLTLNGGHLPHILRCTGTVTISGGIDGDGLGSAGGASVTSAGSYTDGLPGAGPGGGRPKEGVYGGGGGGHAATGTAGAGGGGDGGPAYNGLGAIIAQVYGLWCAGSGGASGAAETGGNSGAGGAGGEGLIIAAPKIVLSSTCSISLDGANGSAAADANSGGGGGGSGGFLLLLGEVLELHTSGTLITATAGSGGNGFGIGTAGGAGAVGRVYLCYLRSLSPSDATSRSNPAAVAVDLLAPMGLG